MNFSKKSKKPYEPANMPKKETILTEYYKEPPLIACPIVAKVQNCHLIN